MAEQTEDRFTEALQKMIEQITVDCGYQPEQYIQTVTELDGVQAAKQLLAEPQLSDDSVQLWARGRPDLTIEAIVSNDDWKTLFSDEERSVAEWRRAKYQPISTAAIHLKNRDFLSEEWGTPPRPFAWTRKTYPVESSWTHELSTSCSTMTCRSMTAPQCRSTRANRSSESSRPCTTPSSLASGQCGSLLFPLTRTRR